MTFNDNIRIDSNRVKTSRATAGTAIGGIGSVVALLFFLFTGQDVSGLLSGTGGSSGEGVDVSHCQTGADANQYVECRMIATAESLDVLWTSALPEQANMQYVAPGFTIFDGGVDTACGRASSAVGPFYCPGDQTVYIDTGFFNTLETQLGATNAPLPQMYIVAHEWGHHIQNLVGIKDQVNTRNTGASSDAVRLELQADCLAGEWVRYASSTVDPDTGVPFLQPPTESDIRGALEAAAAVGDDRIQEQQLGYANPDSFSHGTSEQRMRWFVQGYEGGSIASCDTFSVDAGNL